MSDSWYLEASGYYVPAGEATDFPVRQGDVFAGPEVDGERWLAAQLVHPTCDLAKRPVRKVQLVRVRPLSDLSDDHWRRLVIMGYREREGHVQVAAAHTFFLPPWSAGGEPAYADFRDIVQVDRAAIEIGRRAAAITHDCRVTFIRRWLYFRFRHSFSFETIRDWEAQRIFGDPAFAGPGPSWATAAS